MSRNLRKYNVADAVLLQQGSVVAAMLPADLPALGAFDHSYADGPAVLARLEALCRAASDSPPGTIVVAELMQLTSRVEKEMEAACACYRRIVYFMKQAFPDDPAVAEEFGASDYAAARRSQPGMLLFMRLLVKVVDEYRAPLAAAGASAALLDSVALCSRALEDAEVAQESAKRKRAGQTHRRILAFNALYDELLRIAEVAALVFEEQPSRAAKYQMPQPSRSRPARDDDDAGEEPAEESPADAPEASDPEPGGPSAPAA